MSELLSSIAGGGDSPWITPQIPTPLSGEGFVWNDGNIVPHKGTLIDSVEIPIDSAAGTYVGRLAAATIWTVLDTDINAAVDHWLGAYSNWYGSVNDRLWVWGIDTTTTPDTIYTAYITLETGAITNVGNTQFTTDPASSSADGDAAVSRTAIDSGNFTLKFNDRTIVIDESDGSEVSNVASTNTSESLQIGNYTTLDGTIAVEKIQNTTVSSFVALTKNGNTVLVPIVDSLFSTITNTIVNLIPWGDKVKLIENSGTVQERMLRTFTRTEFDTWIVAISKLGGLA